MSTPEPVDVMVIGSGFGGAVAALRLTQQGIRTVMLERGRRWPLSPAQDTFSSLQDPDGRSAWLSDVAILGDPKPIDRYVGVLELVLGKGIVAFAGAGVGGGSLVYAGVLLQPPRDLFRRLFGRRVDYDEMDAVYFDRVRSVVKPKPIPRRILDKPEYQGARIWLELGSQAGLPTELCDLAVDWRVVAEELTGERVPSVVAGDFWYGNNSGAKRSLDRNYLRLAERSRRLEIATQHDVTSIEEAPKLHKGRKGRYLVTADVIADDGTVVRQQQYLVRKLFLAAGSIGTSKLLVRAKARGWLPRLNDDVGTGWGNNGDFFSALDGFAPSVQPSKGGTAVAVIRHPDNPVSPTAVECFADWTREKQQGVVPSVGMSPIPAKGTFAYDAATDDVVLEWPGTDPEIQQSVAAGEATYELLAGAGEGRRSEPVRCLAYGLHAHRSLDRSLDADTTPVDASATAHPLGGVPLGLATDNVGTVRNYPGLYVIDGALVPGNAGCSNPALTIAGLAERNIERIIERDF
jgi:cholesterol oxidase